MVRRGVSLIEIVLAVAVASGCGVAMVGSLTTGAATAARAGEAQLATVVAARLMDRMVAAGYDGLIGFPSAEGPLELPAVDGTGVEPLVADGVEFRARYQLSLVRDGLVRVVVELSWERSGTLGAGAPGRLSVMRYVADPARALDAR